METENKTDDYQNGGGEMGEEEKALSDMKQTLDLLKTYLKNPAKLTSETLGKAISYLEDAVSYYQSSEAEEDQGGDGENELSRPSGLMIAIGRSKK